MFTEKSPFGLPFSKKMVPWSPLKETQNGLPKNFPPWYVVHFFLNKIPYIWILELKTMILSWYSPSEWVLHLLNARARYAYIYAAIFQNCKYSLVWVKITIFVSQHPLKTRFSHFLQIHWIKSQSFASHENKKRSWEVI